MVINTGLAMNLGKERPKTLHLRIEFLDLCFQVRECCDQGLERGNGIGWQAACRVFDDCN